MTDITIPRSTWDQFIAEHNKRQSTEDGHDHDCGTSSKPACRLILTATAGSPHSTS